MGEWLESLVPWGTQFIIWLQGFSDNWLEEVFKFFTFLCNEEFYLILLPFVYWCIDRKVGIALGYLSMLSVWFNDVIKYVFRIPRPAGARIRTPLPETSPSFPSGHAQNAVTNWGYLAYRARRPLFTVVAIVLMFLIGLSRIVLGVHFPQDVLAGWLIGLVLLAVYAWTLPRVVPWLQQQPVALQAVLAIAFPLLLILLHPVDLAGRYPAEGAITPAGALVGLGIGVLMERAWLRFVVDGAWWRRGLRFVLGLVIVVMVYAGPKLILPEEMAYGLEALARFVRYALLGWVTAFFCPWLFVKMGLAGREADPANRVP